MFLEFSYDAYKRALQMRKLTGNPLVEDRCQCVDYVYDEGVGVTMPHMYDSQIDLELLSESPAIGTSAL